MRKEGKVLSHLFAFEKEEFTMATCVVFVGKTNSMCGFDIFYDIPWLAVEDFDELIKFGSIRINDTTAEKIEALDGLSIRGKILLSAITGAAIQYLIDKDIPFTGEWEIMAEKEVD